MKTLIALLPVFLHGLPAARAMEASVPVRRSPGRASTHGGLDDAPRPSPRLLRASERRPSESDRSPRRSLSRRSRRTDATEAPTASVGSASSADEEAKTRWWIWAILGIGILLAIVAVYVILVNPFKCVGFKQRAAKETPYLRRRNSSSRRNSRGSRGSRQMSRQSSAGMLLAELGMTSSSRASVAPKTPVGRGSSSSKLLENLERASGSGRHLSRNTSSSAIDLDLRCRNFGAPTGTHVIAIAPEKVQPDSKKIHPSTIYFATKSGKKQENVTWQLEDVIQSPPTAARAPVAVASKELSSRQAEFTNAPRPR